MSDFSGNPGFINFINLTPHTVTIVTADGNHEFDIKPSGKVARLTNRLNKEEDINVGGYDFAVNSSSYSDDVIGLPFYLDHNHVYIVSAIVAQNMPDHYKKSGKVFSPDTFDSAVVRDDHGHNIVKVKGLVRYV